MLVNMSETDLGLLARYVRHDAEEAFTEIVQRHVALVYSAALRQVRSPQLAEEVAQSAFLKLAHHAHQLAPDTVVSAWLYQVTRREAIDVVRREARRQLREQVAFEMNAMNATTADWTQIEPVLDEAMHALEETDRAAVLLRYFENKSLQEVGQTLGTSDDAAQKRVSRAVERLREFFSKRGVTVGASGLALIISANAVQAAPAGLAITISTAAAVSVGTTVAATAVTTTTKTIAMTTLQKTLVAAALVAAVGTGIFETHHVWPLRNQVRALRRQQAPLFAQIDQLTRERDDALAAQAALQRDNETLRQTAAEVPKLRGEVARLRAAEPQIGQAQRAAVDMNNPAIQHFLAMKSRADEIARHLEQRPDKNIPELKLLNDVDWLSVTREARLDTDEDIRKTLSMLRRLAKNHLPMGRALNDFTRANQGQLPTDLSQLKPYVNAALGDAPLSNPTLDAIFDRYALLRTGNVSDLPPDATNIAEKAPVDKEYDSRAKFGNGRSWIVGTGIDSTVDPEDKSY